MNIKNNKISQRYICSHCKYKCMTIGVIQKETHYYKIDLETKQWEDFNGDENVESQKLFCLKCEKRINSNILK